MRITFVLPCIDLSGGCRVVADYAERLRRRGHDVLVIAAPPQPLRFRRRLRSWLEGRGFPRQPVQGPSHFDGRDVPYRVLESYRPIRSADLPDADVIVATWWETAEWIAPLPERKGVKLHFVQGDEANPLWMPPHLIDRAIAAHHLPLSKITISRSLAALLRERYGVSDVTLIPNAVDLELFQAPPRERRPRPTVGLLYSTMPLKGCDVSLRAIESVRGSFPELELLAFGAEDIDPALPLPTGARYERTPAQQRIRELYAQCDVWLCGSRCEGFHLPPLEAMACRTPVVSTRVGGPDDLVVDGRNGFLVDIGDAGALAARLHQVLAMPEAEWRKLSEGAYRTATAYTWNDAVERFEAAARRASAKDARSSRAYHHALA